MSYRLSGVFLGHLGKHVLTASGVQPRLIVGVPFSFRRASGVSSPNPSDEGGKPKQIESYWGVSQTKPIKEDGTVWKWNSFRVCLFSSSLKKNQIYISSKSNDLSFDSRGRRTSRIYPSISRNITFRRLFSIKLRFGR